MLAYLLLALVPVPAVLAQVRVLYQNDLSLNSNATSAILISDPVVGANAAAACSRYNEKPLPSVTADLRDQLKYLVFRGAIQNSTQIYIGGGSSARLRFKRDAQCQLYNVGFGLTSVGNCTASLPVLCTNSAPPYDTYINNKPSPGSLVPAGSGSNSFTGFRDARSFRFLGIPYAQPPLGDLRFANAQPYSGSYNNFTALKINAGCLQDSSGGLGGNANANYTEDCLYLNVFTPQLPSTGASGNGLPVAFWIYGGAFTSGSSAIPEYDGGNMASRGDVVVVSINYRLGALGNLASKSLNGSQGISDQIQALKWVQQNIKTFGGDPSKVTIFGESAGGQSVVALLSSTPAKGLFAQAISQSAPWGPFFTRQVSVQGAYPAILAATGCNSTTDETKQLACIRSVNANVFLSPNTSSLVGAASAAAQRTYSQAPTLISAVEPWLPTFGTGIIDGLFSTLVQNGKLPSSGIPFMIGNMQDEGTLFVESVPQLQNPLPATPAVLDLLLSQSFDNNTSTAISKNPTLFAFNNSNPDALRYLAAQLVTLDTWQCPLQQQLAVAKQKNTFSALYSYRFDKGESQSQATQSLPRGCTANSTSGYDAVCHSEDVPLVFGTNNVRGSFTPYDNVNGLHYTQYVQDCWTSFIRTGDPQPNAAYLQARGSAYASTLAFSQVAPFGQYNGNSSTSMHVFDAPPRNSAPFYQAQCQVLQDAGFLYQNVQSM